MPATKPLLVFITGVSGVGKTTLSGLLQATPLPGMRVHDFDELGVPPNADRDWRMGTTRFWLQRAAIYQAEGMGTVITGSTSPAEITALLPEFNLSPPLFIYLNLDDEAIRERLLERGWTDEVIQANLNWAAWLKKELVGQQRYALMEVTGLTPEQVMAAVINAIRSHR